MHFGFPSPYLPPALRALLRAAALGRPAPSFRQMVDGQQQSVSMPAEPLCKPTSKGVDDRGADYPQLLSDRTRAAALRQTFKQFPMTPGLIDDQVARFRSP